LENFVIYDPFDFAQDRFINYFSVASVPSVAQTTVFIRVNSWLIPCRIEKNRRKKAKMNVNLEFIRVNSWLI